MQNIKDKYVICSFGIDSHKLVKVESETKAKFTFAIEYEKSTSSKYTQMKNTIIAIGTKEELNELFESINFQEKIITKARKERSNILRNIRNTDLGFKIE